MRAIPLWLAGALVGILNILLLVFVGNVYFLGNVELLLDPMAGMFNQIDTRFTFEHMFTFMAILMGVMVGSLISALKSGEFTPSIPAKKILAQGFAGGLIMGFGASISLACNYGHLIGATALSLAGIIALAGVAMGCWIGLKIISR
jgi:hypothetical protein